MVGTSGVPTSGSSAILGGLGDDQVVGLLWMGFFPVPKKRLGYISLVVVSLVPCVFVLLVGCVSVCVCVVVRCGISLEKWLHINMKCMDTPKFAPGEALEYGGPTLQILQLAPKK